MFQVKRGILLIVAVCVLTGIAPCRSDADVLYSEDFSTDVIGSGDWMGTSPSVFVDTTNGCLRIDNNSLVNDSAYRDVSFQLPVVIESRMRLVSGGGNYTVPGLGLAWGGGDTTRSTITYLANTSPGDQWGWRFVTEWTDVHTMGPTGENQWITIKAVFRTDGGDLLAKTDADTSFTEITTVTWSRPNEIIRIRLSQPWDAICEMDYITVSSEDNETSSIQVPPVAVKPCDNCELGAVNQPIMSDLTQPARGATISLKIPDGVEVCDINFDGCVTEGWDFSGYIVKPDSGFFYVWMASSAGDVIPMGESQLFNVSFVTSRECRESKFLHWDTALSVDPGRATQFADTSFPANEFYPLFDSDLDSTEILGYEPGDLDDDGSVTMGDLTILIDNMFITLQPVCVAAAGDLNCDGTIAMGDLTTIIDNLFISLQPLECCTELPAAKSATTADVGLIVQQLDNETVVSVETSEPLRGVQVEYSGANEFAPVSSVAGRLDLIHGNTANEHRLGIVDIDGGEIIPVGVTELFRTDGELDVTLALVSDMNHRVICPEIRAAAKGEMVPASFALHQNYPNPFNPSTQIAFSLPEAGPVRLEIYNVRGQRVATLIDGQQMSAGEHSITWDASAMATGVYLYRLEAGDNRATRKMLLMK